MACSLNGDFLRPLAKEHYESRYNPPRKAFDFYVAAALVRFLQDKDLLKLPHRRLFYSDEYGLSFVSRANSWEDTLKRYVEQIDTTVNPADPPFIKTKKEYFQREISIMSTIEHLPSLEV